MAVFTQVSFSGTLDSKGRITVPARIRKRFKLEEGGQLYLKLESGKLVREEVESYQEALEFVSQFSSIQSFSFSEGVVEVILSE